MAKPEKSVEPASLEDAMSRLEAIVREMESGDLSLDTLIERYEEGAVLSKFCQTRLDAAEKKIKVISTNADGDSALEPFDPESDDT